MSHRVVGRVIGRPIEEVVAAEAGVPVAALRVEDPQPGPAARWAPPVASDQRIGLDAHDLAPATDPAAAMELEPEMRTLHDRPARPVASRHGPRIGLDDHHQRPGPASDGGEPVDPRRHRRPTPTTDRQIEDRHVDRPGGEKIAGHGQRLVERGRDEDGQPVHPDATGGRLERIEAAHAIDPADDRAGRLGLRDEAERQRRDAGRPGPGQDHAPAARHAGRAEDGIEGGEAGPERRLEPGDRTGIGIRQRIDRQRAHHRGDRPRRRITPANLERAEGRREIRRRCRHHLEYRTSVL